MEEPFAAGRITVDGEAFDVVPSDDARGHHLEWVSGPNPGYGFTCQRSDGKPGTEPQLRAQIRDFLAHIDPATGYLD